MKKSTKILLLCISCVVFIGVDRITKTLAKQHLQYQMPITYLHDTIVLQYAENTGAAMSLGDGMSPKLNFWLLSILPLIFLAILFIYVVRELKDFPLLKLISYSMVIAGGLGNIIDRLQYDRHVTDFMNLGIGSLRTGIFNFADMCVTGGIIGLIISYNKKDVVEPVSENTQVE